MPSQKNKPLKIGFVLDDGLDNPDGVQQYILALGDWFKAQGHEVSYLVGHTTRTDIEGVHSMSRNMKVRFNGNRLSMPLPTSSRKLRRFLKDEQRFDVLHIQVPYSPFMAHRLIMAADDRTAVIGTFHVAPNYWLSTWGNHALGIWLRRSLKRFDRMLSVSQTAKDFARSTFRIDSEILPNVINYARFHDAKPLDRYRDDRLTVLFLGRLVPRKGSVQLLKAVAKLAAEPGVPEFRVLICGSGPLEGELKKLIRTHGLENKVELAGFVSEDDKPRYYASADVSVFPSTGGESFGIVLLEAMASGRSAVLAGDNPGYRSVLEARPEMLVDPDDIDAFSKKLAEYLRDAPLRQNLQEWGAGFSHDFDVNVVGKKLFSVYDEALHKRRDP